jgi:WD40 repeat protein
MPQLQVTPNPILHSIFSQFCTSREQGWIASGSFDRTIKLWDLSRSSQAQPAQPVVTFTPPESSGPKASIYALAVDPQGNTVVSGGPERVIRMWDPRVGRRIGKLVGHTDNIRAILISEDSRCVGCNLPFTVFLAHFGFTISVTHCFC